MSVLQKFLEWEQKNPNRLLFRQPVDGKYITWTFKEAGNEIRRITAGFQSLGLQPGDHIAILSKNCAHWIMADLAIMMGGFVSIPIYPTLTAQGIRPILEHSGAKAIMVGKLDDYENQIKGIPEGIQRLGIDLFGSNDTHTWEEWIKENEPTEKVHNWQPDELFTIMYTSGTTGKPKGVMHVMGSIDLTAKVAIEELGLINDGTGRMFSYLPLSHIAERAGIEVVGIYTGVNFTFAESLETFPQNLADTQPTVFFAVPRIWAKFREKIEEKLPPSRLNLLLKIPIINSVIKKSIKKKLGLSQATHIFSGAAPITVDMLQWYDKLDIRILQAYGMTEDSIYAHFNRNDANKHGTVGIPFKGLQRKISEEGEIRVKSVALTKGYYKEPEMTKELFDDEGFLKTGDLGEIDKEGYLTITGRSKDQFKTDKGKYISPAPIEMKLEVSPDIENVCVVGTGVPQPIALLVLSQAGKSRSRKDLISSIEDTISSVNSTLEGHENLSKAVIIKEAWTVENGLMTPTLKVKRNEVEKIHLNNYPSWYKKREKVIWEAE